MIIGETALVLGVIERIMLAKPVESMPIDHAPLWQALACFAIAAAIVAVLMLRRRPRRGDRTEAEMAFAALASKLKMKRSEAALIRELAAATGAAPVAMLLSADLFDQAAGPRPDKRVAALRAKLSA